MKPVEVARKAVEALVAGDMETLASCIADDVQIHVPGSSQLSGTYKSRDGLMTTLFGKIMGLTGGQFRLEIHDVIGGDEHAAGIYNITATRDGKTLQYRHVNVYHVRGDQIVEIFQCPHDFEAWSAFWS